MGQTLLIGSYLRLACTQPGTCRPMSPHIPFARENPHRPCGGALKERNDGQ